METDQPRRGSCYDKILKENMEANLPDIVKQVLSIEMIKSEEIPDDLQHTKERKPDLLKRVQDETGLEFILHIEYQSQNDTNMAYRMAEYSVMLQRKYKIPVSQHVIYLGKEQLKMPTCINTKNFKFRYDAKVINKIDYRLFLNSEVVETKLMTILGDFKEIEPKAILTELINDIKNLVVEELAYNKYINQLRALAPLRGLEETLKEVMDDVKYLFVKEKDPYYREGKAEGKVEGITIMARSMKKEGCEIPLIVKITGLTETEIQNFNT